MLKPYTSLMIYCHWSANQAWFHSRKQSFENRPFALCPTHGSPESVCMCTFAGVGLLVCVQCSVCSRITDGSCLISVLCFIIRCLTFFVSLKTFCMDGRSAIEMNAKIKVICVIPHIPEYRNNVTDAITLLYVVITLIARAPPGPQQLSSNEWDNLRYILKPGSCVV